jgi:hypothetical protein
MAKFHHASLRFTYQLFRENGSAYIVMPYYLHPRDGPRAGHGPVARRRRCPPAPCRVCHRRACPPDCWKSSTRGWRSRRGGVS